MKIPEPVSGTTGFPQSEKDGLFSPSLPIIGFVRQFAVTSMGTVRGSIRFFSSGRVTFTVKTPSL